jgi:hypothetical protein
MERICRSIVAELRKASKEEHYGQRNFVVVAGDPDSHHHPACSVLALRIVALYRYRNAPLPRGFSYQDSPASEMADFVKYNRGSANRQD